MLLLLDALAPPGPPPPSAVDTPAPPFKASSITLYASAFLSFIYGRKLGTKTAPVLGCRAINFGMHSTSQCSYILAI